MKKKFLIFAIILAMGIAAFAQTDIAVQLLTSGTLYVYERHYSYDGITGPDDVAIELPCEVVRGRERQTAYILALFACPDGDGSGEIALHLIPSRGEDWGAAVAQWTVETNGIGCISYFALPMYPGSKMKLTWTNPGTVKWNLTIFTRAIVS